MHDVFTIHFNTLSDGDTTAELHMHDDMVWSGIAHLAHSHE